MSYSFVNKPSVNCEIIDVVDYYKSIKPELAIAFLDRLKEAKSILPSILKLFR